MKRTAVVCALFLVITACGETPTTDDTVPERTEPATDPGDFNSQTVPPSLVQLTEVWETDFSMATVDLSELLLGIPARDPRDLIRPIDDPRFDTVAATTWIADQEPGIFLEVGDAARFYPLSILTRHEIVNDVFGEVPVAVTYCPLCNTALVFDRRFDGGTLRLGVSGLLRNSDLVMWDDSTQSLWQQVTGEAIVGELAGAQLEVIPAPIVRWADFANEHPDGMALSSDQGFGGIYGINPYTQYSSREQPFPFFEGDIDDRLPALERVVGVTVGDSDVAYPFSLISEIGAVNDTIDDEPIAVFWGAPDTTDALDRASIAESRGIGTGIAFSREVDGMILTFESSSEFFIDEETGTTWSILGSAIAGDLEGAQLELLPHRNEFWFAWQAFFPAGELYDR